MYQAKLPMIQRWNEILCKMLFANLEGLLGKPLSAPYLWNKFFWILVDLIHALGDDDLVLFPFLPLPIGTGHLSNDSSHCHGGSISDTKRRDLRKNFHLVSPTIGWWLDLAYSADNNVKAHSHIIQKISWERSVACFISCSTFYEATMCCHCKPHCKVFHFIFLSNVCSYSH